MCISNLKLVSQILHQKQSMFKHELLIDFLDVTVETDSK